MATRVSRKDLAERWGVKRQAVDKLVRDGKLKPDKSGMIDLASADAVRAAMNPNIVAKEAEARALGGQRSDQQDVQHPMVKARLAREVLSTRIKDLEFRKLTGELISRAEVKGALFEVGRTVQQTLRTWPARLSGEIAAMKGLSDREFYAAAEAIFDRETKKIVSDLTKALERIAATDKAA